MPPGIFAKYRFALTLGLSFLLQAAVAAAVWLLAGSFMEPGLRLVLLAALAAIVLLMLGIGLKACFKAYLLPISRLAEEISLLAANPGYRLAPQGASELRDLIGKLNEFAAAYHALRAESQAKIASDNHALTEERNRLAALMSELSAGVLVCNIDGRILLYNRRARQLLERGQADIRTDAAPVGLGRSLFGMIDRGTLMQALEQVRQQLQPPGSAPGPLWRQPEASASFVAALAGGRSARVRMAPVLDEANALDGFVLVFDEPGQDQEAAADKRHASQEGFAAQGQQRLERRSRPVFYDFDLFRHTGQDAELDWQPLAQLNYTAFDTETTGLHPAEGDEIIAIGAVRIVNGRLLAQEYFDRLIRPRCEISAASVDIHGITEAMLAGQPRIEEVLPLFGRFVEDTVLVAHNAAFDLRFLQMQEDRTGVRLRQPVLDTLLLSQVLHPHQAEHSLEAIAARLGVEVVGRHTALGDAIVTGEVFLRMLPLLAAKGVRTLAEAREAERQTRYARLRY